MEPIVMIEECLGPEETAAAERRRAQFLQNADWLEEHVPEVYSKYRGKCICIAGKELFAANTATEAAAKAKAAHPNDEGRLTRYIPKDRVARIYAS